MEKNKQLFALKRQSCIKYLLHMKLTIAFILIMGLQLSAKTYSQQRITLKLQSAELKTALKQIEKKSIFRFLYNNDVLSADQKINIDANNLLVTDVLNDLFSNTALTYRILDNNLVVITQKNFVAQADVKVTGRVTNAAGEAVPGVSIKIKGSAVGTSTDAAGFYSISVPDGARLVFSSIGYEEMEVAVNNRSQINITLVSSTKSIDAVVVIGYGVANKRDLTGSIVKVLGKDIADKPNTNPIASLQGKVAGLSVVNNGTPGAAPDIRIRGTVSIGQVHPLYVVDGIFNDNIDYLNPNDIESIEILKDPSSLAIFGVKGATGVIAITTKKARAGQTIVNFNTSYGTKKLVDKIKLVDAAGFKLLFDEENANNGVTTPDYSALTANTDWIDAVTRTGKFSNNNLSIAGSTEKNKFNFGLGYIYDEGIIKHEKLEKMQLSFSDEFKINKFFKIGINLNSSRQNNPFGAGGVLDDARKVMPAISAGTKSFKVANPYGGDSITTNIYSGLATAFQNSGVVNPLLGVENTWNKRSNIEYRHVGSVYAEVNFLRNFTLRSTVYADMSNIDNRVYDPLYYAYNPITNTPYLYGEKTQVGEYNDDYKKFQQDHILTYKKSFGDHSFNATAGFTTYYFSHF